MDELEKKIDQLKSDVSALCKQTKELKIEITAKIIFLKSINQIK